MHAKNIVQRRRPRGNQRSHALRMFGVRYAFKEAVRRSQEWKCHFGTIDEWRETFVVAFTRFAEKHRFNPAARAQGFLDQPDSFDADATGFRL
jgi:hypothetical protein